MTGALLLLGWAVAVATPPVLPVHPDDPVWVWTGAPEAVLEVDRERCTLVASERVIPAGLPARAVRARHTACDLEVVSLTLPSPEKAYTGVSVLVAGEGLQGAPPRDRWSDATPQPVFLHAPRTFGWLPALVLDPKKPGQWTFFVFGERAELLASDPGGYADLFTRDRGTVYMGKVPAIAVVRLSDGTTVLVDGESVRTDDAHVAKGRVQTRRQVDRLQEGRARHGGATALTPLPQRPALLAEARRGETFFFRIDPLRLRDPAYTDEWLDPVGQVHDRTCPPVGTWEAEAACGPVWLDYRAFGAWWPREEQSVVAVYEGTIRVGDALVPHLRVLVRDLWQPDLLVSPDW